MSQSPGSPYPGSKPSGGLSSISLFLFKVLGRNGCPYGSPSLSLQLVPGGGNLNPWVRLGGTGVAISPLLVVGLDFGLRHQQQPLGDAPKLLSFSSF